MHEPIRAGLETYLENPEAAGREFREHLEKCRDCVAELRQMTAQSGQMRALRVEYAEPAAGFYARVMDRIEAQSRPSAGSLMRDTAFGWRVALASAAAVLMMAGYMVSSEPARVSDHAHSWIARDAGLPAQPEQARNTVLATLASFPE